MSLKGLETYIWLNTSKSGGSTWPALSSPWVMWYLPWPASSPTSSPTTSYYLIYCGLDDDSVMYKWTHTCTNPHVCSQMQSVHLTAGVFTKMVSRPFVFFFLKEEKQRHMLWVTAVCHDDPSERTASCVGGDVVSWPVLSCRLSDRIRKWIFFWQTWVRAPGPSDRGASNTYCSVYEEELH